MKKKFLTAFIFCFNILLLVYIAESMAGNDQKLTDYVLKEIENANKETISIKANIKIIRSIPLLESEDVSEGSFTYRKPKRFFIKFKPPRNEVNIIDDKHIWIYHIDQSQVEKYSVNNMGNDSFMNVFFNFGINETADVIKEKFEVRIQEDDANLGSKTQKKKKSKKHKFYRIELNPRPGKSSLENYSKIKIWVQDGKWVPIVIELDESGGEVLNRIELTKMTINGHISPKDYQFNIPDDVIIIEPLK